jgi:hypothetical protein
MAMDEVSEEQFNRVVWALFWRYTVGSVVAGFIAGFLVSFVIGFAWAFYAGTKGIPRSPMPTSVDFLNTVASALAGLLVSYFVLKWVLRRLQGRRIAGVVLRLDPTDAHSMDRT